MLLPNPPRASTTVPLGGRVPPGERASDLGIEWDAEGRLLAVKDGPNTLASFTYGRRGRRATKTAAGLTTSYVYDDSELAEERLSGGTTSRYIYGSGTDHVIAQIVTGVTSYFISDHLGSIVRNSDILGAPTLQREYDPWGNLLQGTTTGGHAYTGREWDAETSLYYYRARFYSASQGRFLSEDPLQAKGRDSNLYQYARNRPVLLGDPFGTVCQIKAWQKGKTASRNWQTAFKQDVGHAWLEWPGGSAGFWPAVGVGVGDWFTCVPGELAMPDPYERHHEGADARETYWKLTGSETPPGRSCECAVKCIRDFASKYSYPYCLGARNCRSFVTEALDACGLSLQRPRLPVR